MDYKVEFERLLVYARQAIGSNLGAEILKSVIEDYERRIERREINDCSYSPDKVHEANGENPVCIWCEGEIK